MGFFFDFVKSILLWTVLLFVFLIVAPGLPPYDITYVSHEDPPQSVKFEGPLKPNELLKDAELLSGTIEGSTIGYLKGVESFAVKDGFLYSGVQGGDIIRLPLSNPKTKPWSVVSKIGGPCHGLYEEEKCGRPLGLEFDSQGRMVVADGYFGLFRVNVDSGAKEVLVPSTLEIEGAKNLITNSIAIAKDSETIYYTSSSTNFKLSDGMYEILAAPSGRVLQYDVASNTSKVLMKGLAFANGIVLSPKEEFLLVCETGGQRVWKYHLKGAKKGQSEVVANLPGAVDNIKSNGKDGYLVGVVVPTLPDKFYLLWHIRARSYICKLLTRLCVLVQNILSGIDEYVFSSPAIKMIIHQIGNTEYMGANILPPYALIVELNEKGEMTRSWHSPAGGIDKICEGFVHDGYMYLGSPYNLYVSRIPFSG